MAREPEANTDSATRSRRSFLLGLAAFLVPGSVLASGRNTVVATGYCACHGCCGANSPDAGGRGLTATGKRPHPGVTVAADWSLFPPGTRLFIQDIGDRVVQDRGRGIVGPRIDIFFRSHGEAVAFGRRKVGVRVVR
jgi:3D (Asp-Asp-Asp) domain-containing protein